jgi:hypothetical protein
MYITIRRYEILDEQITARSISDRVKDELLAEFESIDGFREYFFLESGDSSIATVTICDSSAAVEESTDLATRWVRDTYGPDAFRRTDVTTGEVLLARSLVGQV